MDALPRDDYLPPARPLADDPRASLLATPFHEIVAVSGQPEPFRERLFSTEAVALAKAGRIASAQVGSDGSAVFREGVHPATGARFLVFPRPLARRALFRLDRAEVKRFFPI